MISLIALVLAFVCFVLAAIPTVPSTVNWVAIGLALFAASFMVMPLLGLR
jgi:hypothetical protein